MMALSITHSHAAEAPPVTVKIVEGGESKVKPEKCLATLVGPGKNQPEKFPGYGGFVGWVSPVRLKSGEWFVGFSAGYWHGSPATPYHWLPEQVQQYEKLGLPKGWEAPTGGRAMIMRSTDQGKTWSKPITMLDTPIDDRYPSFIETPDGTLLCSMFLFTGADLAIQPDHPELATRSVIIRSRDRGKTWEKKVIRPTSPFYSDETDGPMHLLKDGSVLLTVTGKAPAGGPKQAAFLTSRDSGLTWQLRSTVKAAGGEHEVTVSKKGALDSVRERIVTKEHNLDEANAVELPDGRWVMIARSEGEICWSSDQGRTWTEPVPFGMKMFAPALYVLRDGTLVCLHGSYAPKFEALRVIFSNDGGHTWIAPAADHGFLVSQCYGYGKAMVLPDDTLYVVEQETGGHRTQDAANMSIRCLRLRIRPDHSGIDLLPAPNR